MKTILIFFVLLVTFSVFSEIPGVKIKDLKKLKTKEIITAVSGMQQTGYYNDGTISRNLIETYFENGNYEIQFGNEVYRGKWKAKNNKICYKEGTKTKFECVKMYVSKEGPKKYYFVMSGVIYARMDTSISLVQLKKDEEKKRLAEIKRQEELNKKEEERQIAEEKKYIKEIKIIISEIERIENLIPDTSIFENELLLDQYEKLKFDVSNNHRHFNNNSLKTIKTIIKEEEEKIIVKKYEEKAAEEKRIAEEKAAEEKKIKQTAEYIEIAKVSVIEITELINELKQYNVDALTFKESLRVLEEDILNNTMTLNQYKINKILKNLKKKIQDAESDLIDSIYVAEGEKRAKTNPGFRNLIPGISSEVANKICYAPKFFTTCFDIDNIKFKTNTDGRILKMVTLDMGPIVDKYGGLIDTLNEIFSEEENNVYLKYRDILNSKYRLDFKYNERDRQLFNENEKRYLFHVYNKGQVVIRIFKDSRQDSSYYKKLVLYIEYRDVDIGLNFLEAHRPVRAETSDF